MQSLVHWTKSGGPHMISTVRFTFHSKWTKSSATTCGSVHVCHLCTRTCYKALLCKLWNSYLCSLRWCRRQCKMYKM